MKYSVPRMEMRKSAEKTLQNERMFSAAGSQVYIVFPGVLIHWYHSSDRTKNAVRSLVLDMSTRALILTRLAVKTAMVAMMIPRQLSRMTIRTAFHWIFTPYRPCNSSLAQLNTNVYD
jgi:hypothetical protein